MLRRSEAIVLRTTLFSEADLIVTALTPDYGLMKAFAKSPRKTRSRFGSSFEPLTYCRIAFWGKEDAALPRLTQADIIKPFQSLRERIDCFLKVMEMAELTLSLLAEREAHRDIFHLFLSLLTVIERDGSGEEADSLTPLLYKIRFLDMAGYGPRLKGCARCGKSGYDFYLADGSVLCGRCAKAMDAFMRLSPGVVKSYEALRTWDMARINRIKLSPGILSELSGMLDTHIRYTIARPLRTKSFEAKS